MTADDVKFSLDRVRYIQLPGRRSTSTNVDERERGRRQDRRHHAQESERAAAHHPGGAELRRSPTARWSRSTAAIATPDSKEKDKATEWLNQNSAGTGPYKLTDWMRNSQIQLVANPNYWGGKPPFQRVVIRHFEDGAAQMLALRRGDIDVAFNLLPEQVAIAEGREGRLDRTARSASTSSIWR